MRIAHVVTLVSADGAFGGPVRVALNLARATQDAGHEVTILGSFRGYDTSPTSLNGVRAKLFRAYRPLPGLGFAGLVAPGLVRYLSTHMSDYDVIHVHLARDMVTLVSAVMARRRGMRYVTQTHGMIDPSSRRLAHVLDAMATRSILRNARALFYLNDEERDEIVAVARNHTLPFVFLSNGVPTSDLRADAGSAKEVLFLARLHAQKRPMLFVDAAIALRERFPQTRFTLVGPDEGEAERVLAYIAAAGVGGSVSWEGPLDPSETLARMSQASVYVLPSVGDLFGMTVVEAMSVGLPTVVTESCGLVPLLHDPASVRVIDHSLEGLVTALSDLLHDHDTRVELGERGRREVERYFSIEHCASVAVAAYCA